MKLAFIGVTAVLMGMGGCASDAHKTGLSGSGYNEDVDYAKMAVITREARSRGYDIVWVNPPVKDQPKNR